MRGIARILFASIFSVSLACCGHALIRAEQSDGLREARQARKLLKGGRPAEGYERFARLVLEHPRQLDINRWYVEAAAKTGRLDDARAYFEKLRASGRMPEVVEYGLALVDAARGGRGLEGAAAHLREAIRLAPETPEFHYRLGLLYLLDSRAAEAQAPLKKALELEPENARYRVVYADALCQLRKDDDAMAVLEPLLRQDVSAEVVKKARGVANRIFDPMRDSTPE
ncbi:MAG: tetratricopeptide repeat protein, partial [Deltaproteobacteria bacterium]